MIQIKIKAKTVKVPTSFEELSIPQVQAISFILGDRDIKDLGINRQVQIMMILFGANANMLSGVTHESIKAFFDKYDILKVTPQKVPDVFKIGRHRYTMVDLDTLSVKDYNKLDYYLVGSKTPFQYAYEIAEILLRRVKGGIYLNWPTRKAYKCGKHCGEKRLTTITNKEFEMIKSSIPSIIYLAIFERLVMWKTDILKDYGIIDREEKKEVKTDTGTSDNKWGKVKDDRAQIFGNYHTLQSICDTPTDMFKWEQQNIHDYLYYLGYFKVSTEIENSKNALHRNNINK